MNTPFTQRAYGVFFGKTKDSVGIVMKNNDNTHTQVGPKLALSRVEAAQALGVSPITVDRLAHRGLLRPSRATRRPLYAVDEIRRFLAETTGSMERRTA